MAAGLSEEAWIAKKQAEEMAKQEADRAEKEQQQLQAEALLKQMEEQQSAIEKELTITEPSRTSRMQLCTFSTNRTSGITTSCY